MNIIITLDDLVELSKIIEDLVNSHKDFAILQMHSYKEIVETNPQHQSYDYYMLLSRIISNHIKFDEKQKESFMALIKKIKSNLVG